MALKIGVDVRSLWGAKPQNPVKFDRVSFYFDPLSNLNGPTKKMTDPYTSEHYLSGYVTSMLLINSFAIFTLSMRMMLSCAVP
jgi:hypothetical protein